VTRDLRKYIRQTNLHLVAGALVLLFIIGDGLIYIFYGSNAAGMGLICLLIGMMPVALVFLVLLLLDWIAKRVNRD
jgi:hypothetical protein